MMLISIYIKVRFWCLEYESIERTRVKTDFWVRLPFLTLATMKGLVSQYL